MFLYIIVVVAFVVFVPIVVPRIMHG